MRIADGAGFTFIGAKFGGSGFRTLSDAAPPVLDSGCASHFVAPVYIFERAHEKLFCVPLWLCVFEVAKNLGHLLECNGFGPYVSSQACVSQSGFNPLLRIALFQIIDQGFSLHGEGAF